MHTDDCTGLVGNLLINTVSVNTPYNLRHSTSYANTSGRTEFTPSVINLWKNLLVA